MELCALGDQMVITYDGKRITMRNTFGEYRHVREDYVFRGQFDITRIVKGTLTSHMLTYVRVEHSRRRVTIHSEFPHLVNTLPYDIFGGDDD